MAFIYKKGAMLYLIILIAFCSCNKTHETQNEDTKSGAYELCEEKHFLNDFVPFASDNLINAVIEIPAGTNDKWEVNKETGCMEWEFKDGVPRVVEYLAYPANYGMIPQTLLPENAGGDGDPLDVLVLGPAVERGSIVQCELIGILYLTDTGEQDDKLVAVMKGTPFDGIETIDELNETFPGVTAILEEWFSSYKGPGKMETHGFGDKKEAEGILNTAIEAYRTGN